MYSLENIVSMNNRPAKATETETTRHCSFHESRGGVVLHSAKRRSTVFIKPGNDTKNFLRKVRSTSREARRDEIIESYFS